MKRHAGSRIFGSQIVTPRFWGGFSCSMGLHGSPAKYHPAINQIWIDRGLGDDERQLASLHESLHAFTMCFQTPQMLALGAELIGAHHSIPAAKHFHDLVEMVCATYFLVHTGLEITPRYLIETDPRRHQLGAELIAIAEGLAEKAAPMISRDTAVREALAGLCTLIMHIVPYRKGFGSTVLRMIRSIAAPQYWEDQWQLFRYFYAEFQRIRLDSPRKLRQFDLNQAIDVHRDMFDMVVNLARAVCAVPNRAVAVTAVFPTLLMLITMRCFRFVPIIYLSTAGGRGIASIHIDHVSRRSLKHMRWAILRQQKNLEQSEQTRQPCHAAQWYITIAEKSRLFITSGAEGRSFSCFQSVLEVIPALMRQMIDAKRVCPQCEAVRRASVFLWAYNCLATMPRRIRAELIQAVGNYEPWLHAAAEELARDACESDEAPRVSVRYRFF
ncbi:MAG: hypothetical protein ACYTEK_12445 [Planctomycetota bacterium]|jgi:hypothetical protein